MECEQVQNATSQNRGRPILIMIPIPWEVPSGGDLVPGFVSALSLEIPSRIFIEYPGLRPGGPFSMRDEILLYRVPWNR